MDPLSFSGLLLGLAAVFLGNMAEGGTASSLLNAPAALIVVGGTVGAALLQTPPGGLKLSLRMLLWVFRPPVQDLEASRKKLINWAQIARREGLLGLEHVSDAEKDLFARRGLQMMVDGSEPQAIRDALETEIGELERKELAGMRFYQAMGGYAPTIGIIGAVLGLIQVMTHLEDPAELGGGIAVAFVATVYGVALANLFLLPVAAKLRQLVRDRVAFREMTVEGIVAIADGEHPHSIQLKLDGFSSRALS